MRAFNSDSEGLKYEKALSGGEVLETAGNGKKCRHSRRAAVSGEEEGNVGPGLEETPRWPRMGSPAAPVPTGLQYFFMAEGWLSKPFPF